MDDFTDTETTTSKRPSYIVSHVRKREGKKSIWTPIGAAWAHSDGKGFTVEALDQRLVLRVPKAKSA